MAQLANLQITPSEEKKFSQQFAETLKAVGLMDELDTAKASPTFQVTGLTNVTRPDQVDLQRMLSQTAALSQAARTHKGFFVVPRTIEDE